MTFFIIRDIISKRIAWFNVEVVGDYNIDVDVCLDDYTDPKDCFPIATFSSFEKAQDVIKTRTAQIRGTFESPSGFWGPCEDEVEIVEVIIP